MKPSEFPNKLQKKRFPHWLTPLFLTGLFLLIHVAAPWRLSLLSARRGWTGRRPGPWNLVALVLVAGGIASTIWMIALHYLASPQPFLEMQGAQNVVTRGLYRFSRNPMYLSELAFWLGWALFYGSMPVLAGFLAWLVFFNFYTIPWEERHLEARYGEAYREYKARVPRWFGLPGD